jgi:hypothetical protein
LEDALIAILAFGALVGDDDLDPLADDDEALFQDLDLLLAREVLGAVLELLEGRLDRPELLLGLGLVHRSIVRLGLAVGEDGRALALLALVRGRRRGRAALAWLLGRRRRGSGLARRGMEDRRQDVLDRRIVTVLVKVSLLGPLLGRLLLLDEPVMPAR